MIRLLMTPLFKTSLASTLCLLLEVWWFSALVDHKPLMFAVDQVAESWSVCQHHEMLADCICQQDVEGCGI